ncbi:type II toxin-antitoxin system death-on-curing family toxin [Alteromonas pelagimontana]|uniref:Type II toxin-antitoxin system death-on-curing family toxin n=1 Tax=Alteromonas pelagimontana TaxID=1858656 RepID=A0A6M4M9W9_9ALTE|nr:type II toxin-antitoxin system death-on-curing family toxin [Alteromonas pelagimontana]QJR79598.1 type II toxin-antitoxin system death-on-curing family toxin [Alteromonas pelagimontana]
MEEVEGIRYLDVDDIIECNKKALAVTPLESFAILDRGKLESAQARPSRLRYYEQCEDVFYLAAAVFISINKAHAFENANKRTGFLASQIFLQINGYHFQPMIEDAIDIAVKVASGDEEHNNEFLLSSWFKAFSNLNEDYESSEQQGVRTLTVPK